MFKYELVRSYTSYIPFPLNSQKELPGSVISSGTDTNHDENILHPPPRPELTDLWPNGHCRPKCKFFNPSVYDSLEPCIKIKSTNNF